MPESVSGAEVRERIEKVQAIGDFDTASQPDLYKNGSALTAYSYSFARKNCNIASLPETVTVRYGVLDAFGQGVRKTWELAAFTVRMLGRMVTGDASLKNISGPITMADFAGQSAQAGALVFVGYLALISISLGVLNLLPIPVLDGGHLLYYLAEIVLGRPVSDRAFEVGQRIGMALLAVLMTLALVNEVSRLF